MGDISSSTEDFLEVCYVLVNRCGEARTSDIAKQLDISMPSVTERAIKLKELGYIIYEKYQPIKLTEKGMGLAIKVHDRHIMLREFFMSFGVDMKNAEEDACKAEHVLSKTTLEKIRIFMRRKNGDICS